MLLIGKWTHSLGCVVLIGSGMLRVPLPRFILVNLLATVPKSAVLFGFGYFASRLLASTSSSHCIVGTIALCAFGGTAITSCCSGGPTASVPDGAGQMRIAMFTDYFFPELGGIQDSIATISRSLARRGHQVDIYAPRYGKAGLSPDRR